MAKLLKVLRLQEPTKEDQERFAKGEPVILAHLPPCTIIQIKNGEVVFMVDDDD